MNADETEEACYGTLDWSDKMYTLFTSQSR